MAVYLGSEQVGGGIDALSILDLVYPVGSVYMSVNSTSPAILFGGTWEQIKDRFLLAAGSTYTVGGTGGSAITSLAVTNLPSHHHSYTAPPSATGGTSLSVSNLPAHYHQIRYQNSSGSTGAGYSWGGSKMSWSAATESSSGMKGGGGSGTAHSHTITGSSSNTGDTGSGTSFSNMPPYLTVYMWKRTA